MKTVYQALFLALVAVMLSACGSTLPNGEKVTDFKASVDAYTKSYEAQADVQFKAQENVGACLKKATSDVMVMGCAMLGQATNFSQALGGQPKQGRQPTTGVEGATAVGTAGLKGATTVGVANAIADGVKSMSEVQAKDPIVEVVRPEVVRPEVVLVP